MSLWYSKTSKSWLKYWILSRRIRRIPRFIWSNQIWPLRGMCFGRNILASIWRSLLIKISTSGGQCRKSRSTHPFICQNVNKIMYIIYCFSVFFIYNKSTFFKNHKYINTHYILVFWYLLNQNHHNRQHLEYFALLNLYNLINDKFTMNTP